MSNILIIDRNKKFRDKLSEELSKLGHQYSVASNMALAQRIIEEKFFDLILLEYDPIQNNAHEVLELIKRFSKTIPIILMLSAEDLDIVVKAVKEGIYDCIQKSFNFNEMLIKINNALKHTELVNSLNYLRHTQDLIYRFDDLIGESPKFKRILSIAQKVANSNSTVLIEGETGTGKGLIAGAIHYNSPRKDHNFIKVNSAVLHENLLESELFGHERGAFTGADRLRIGRFEQANNGTIFLDEIGDMSPSTQAKILRVLEEQEFERLGGTKTIKVNVRLIAATNKELKKLVQEGLFREDLFYRLNVVRFKMPPLRERPEDIIPLAQFFAHKYSHEFGKNFKGFEPSAKQFLTTYYWPGNIRELRNTIERAILMMEGEFISLDDLYLTPEEKLGGAPHPPSALITLPPEGISLDQVERELLIQALERTNWVQKDAAHLLRITPRVMNYKIKNHGIVNKRWRRHKSLSSINHQNS
jgi:DNA-binding NtrC family response regulator